MTTPERWIAHYTRLLAGSLSPIERARALAALEYWREEARLHSPALARLETICQQRGADYHATLARLKEGQ